MILVPDPREYKQCLDCGQVRPLLDFHVRSSRAGTRVSWCRDCARLRYQRRQAGLRPSPRLQVPDGQRRCPDCGEIKFLEEFPRNRSKRSGRDRYCLPCHNVRTRANILKNHGSTREYHLKRRYGITADDAALLLEDEGGRCAICRTELDVTTMHVDHDHRTGRVRGALCFNCNGGLGQFGDDIERLEAAIRYLERKTWHCILLAPDYQPHSRVPGAPPSPTS